MTGTHLLSRILVRLSPLDTGESVRDFLQGLVTNDVSGALPVWAGLLTPQGKVLFDFLIWEQGQDLLIDCEAATADALIKRLSMYRLRRKIAIARDKSLGVHWRSEEGNDPRLPALGTRWLAPISANDQPADAAWQRHRLKLGVAEGQAELGEGTTLWLECNAAELNGVSFSKGCYVGQENTARMNWRQKVNRRVVVVPFDASDKVKNRVAYPDFSLAIQHRRVEEITTQTAPSWLQVG